MTCRPPIAPCKARPAMLAFTMIDMLIAFGIASIVFMAVAAFSFFTARSFCAMANYADLDSRSRNALDRMTHDVRQAKTLITYATNQIVLTNADGSILSYTYNPAAGTLIRTNGGSSLVLLTNCDYLSFDISQRNPNPGFIFPYQPTNQVTQAKLIDVSWRCSRQIMGKKVNTESVQTAKIVIRN